MACCISARHRLCKLPSTSSQFYLLTASLNTNSITPLSRCSPSPTEWGAYLRLLGLCRNMEMLKHVHSAAMVADGLTGYDESVATDILRIYFGLGNPNHPRFAFHKIDRLCLFLWNLMIRQHSNQGSWDDVLFLYLQMQKSGCPSDNFTFPLAIKACSAVSALGVGKQIHSVVLKTGFEWNAGVQTALLDFYAKSGEMEAARQLHDEMSQRDLVSWNALLSGYSLNGFDEEAFKVVNHVRRIRLRPNVSTLISIIPVCTRLGALELGKSIHGVAVKTGFSSDESLVPTLISMYAGCDDLSVARTLFDMFCGKNVVIWNAMISAYVQNGKPGEALAVFQQMHQANVNPNLITLTCSLTSCGDLGSNLYGKLIHACGIKNGFQHEVSMVTTLVSMYGKLGEVDVARFLFGTMPEKNLLSWNSLISCFVQNGFWCLGLKTCYEMQLSGVKPDWVSMISVLCACTKLKDLLSGKSGHAFCLRSGFSSNLNVANTLLALYCHCDRIPTALKVFYYEMPVKNILSWNTLISSCVQSGDLETAFAVLRQMQQQNAKFDLITVISILPAYRREEELPNGMCVHCHAIKMGHNSDISLVNALISMYANCGDLEIARLLFDRMPSTTVVSWNALITGYRNRNMVGEVMALFDRMQLEHHKPNSVTLLSILPLCRTHLEGKSTHAFALRTCSALSETHLLTSILCMYARFDSLNSCRLLFKTADKRNVAVWNAMISVYVQTQRADQSISCFNEMLWLETEPDSVTILLLVAACGRVGIPGLCHSVMGYVIRKGFFKGDVAVSNALIDMNARCGDIVVAREIFDGMWERDAVSWSAMIGGYTMHGDGGAALSLFAEMNRVGVEPDDVALVSVLSACSHAGLVEEGLMHFESMGCEYKMVPRVEHYSCMVDLLGRTGRVCEAYEFLKKMPVRPSVSLLQSLLGACSVYGNVRVGEKVAGLLFELEPGNSGTYVLLSNIYAAAGRWLDAARLRGCMEERGMNKVPGFSIVLGS